VLRIASGKHICWNMSPSVHRVVVRSVLLEHLFCNRGECKEEEKAAAETLASLTDLERRNMVHNLQMIIEDMQVACSHGANIIFDATSSDEIVMYLEGNEEILQGDVLYHLCTHPDYRMNTGDALLSIINSHCA
jgi:hypothetical protein